MLTKTSWVTSSAWARSRSTRLTTPKTNGATASYSSAKAPWSPAAERSSRTVRSSTAMPQGCQIGRGAENEGNAMTAVTMMVRHGTPRGWDHGNPCHSGPVGAWHDRACGPVHRYPVSMGANLAPEDGRGFGRRPPRSPSVDENEDLVPAGGAVGDRIGALVGLQLAGLIGRAHTQGVVARRGVPRVRPLPPRVHRVLV